MASARGDRITPAPVSVTPAPVSIAPAAAPTTGVQPSTFNVNQAAAGGLQQAIQGTNSAMFGQLQPASYMNPYTTQVIQNTEADIARQQLAATNQLASQAGAAGAFGGSRHGVAQGVMAGEFGRTSADMSARQREANYNQALQNAMTDRQQRLGAAGQMGDLGQQAFNTSQAITGQQQQQGLLQQGIQQALIDAARGQYAGYTGSPTAALGAPLSALGVANQRTGSTTTETGTPGLFNYFQAIAGMPMFCWVAREVYGQDDPKWLQFREWVIGYSPNWFYKGYEKYGEKVASIVNKMPALKAIIRPFMDAKRKAIGYK
tara:strand:- start:44 stop:997 length:954 start_codon:yes stop_codon:yes gene_type:complete